MRAAIAGAGIGGLTLALALRAGGVEATLHERAEVLGEAGAGVQLGPNAVKVLDRLGLGEAVRSAAFRPEAAEVRDARTGGLLLRTQLGDPAESRWGAPYLQLHRSDLQALLLEAACARGVALELAARAAAVRPDGSLRLVSGELVEADMAVAADGVRSACADALLGREAPRYTSQVAWRAVLPRSAVGADVPPTATVWTGGGRHLVHYPVRGGREINLVAVTQSRSPPGESWTQPGDAAELARAFAGWPSPGPELIAAAGEVWRWSLHDRPPRPRWSDGRATLLGDAAHPMLPFLAQGAAMAIEDAWVLAGELAAGGGVEAALHRYERSRQRRTAAVQAWSRGNARLFHLPTSLARVAFAAARVSGEAARRLDWLYGWEPPA